MKNKGNITYGHQEGKGTKWRHDYKYFSGIEFLNHDWDNRLAYCRSHHFAYNVREEREKLYNAQPCIYTDSRYEPHWLTDHIVSNNRKRFFSLKSAFRKLNSIRNMPVGTLINIEKSWYYHNKKNIWNNYIFKSTKYSFFDPKYQINKEKYSSQFDNCQYSKELINKMRENGFIVSVYRNNDALVGVDEGGQIAVAYGYGKQIGFSSGNTTYQGYTNGIENILWDKVGEFDKWSRCKEIPKATPIDEVLKLLMTPNEDIKDEY